MRADIECHEPVPVIFDSNCVFHMDLPAPCKLEPMKFEKEIKIKPSDVTDDSFIAGSQAMEIDVVGGTQEIDPDDDMAGLMREMNDAVNNPIVFSGSQNSETSTDTAFSVTTASDKDDLLSV